MSAIHRAASPAIKIEAASHRATKRAPYCAEIELMLLGGLTPNVYLFAGPGCWARAKSRRVVHGAGSAMVLPPDTDPRDLRWPAVDALLVCWPTTQSTEYRAKLLLAQALIRDGVRYAAIEHEPEWLNVWRQGGLLS